MWNQEKANKLVPEHVQGGLQRYIEMGVEPGSFLSAILCNDLREAIARADHINIHRIPDIVNFLYNYAPGQCWGSPAKFEAWMKMHADELTG